MPITISYQQFYDDFPSSTNVTPVHEDGTMLVPLRRIVGLLNGDAHWDGLSQTITITCEETEIKLVIGSKTAFVNGEKKELSMAPRLVDGETMVPLRFIGENFDCYVEWNKTYKRVNIVSKNMSYVNQGEE